MAVSKRLRFEILRRDDHTCHYCGRRPPEVELTIDHVVPQALGGTDEAKNLVTCCKECNGGKTSIAPDSPLVAAVDADAERWSAAVQAAIDKVYADHEAVEEYRLQFLHAWNSYQPPVPLDMVWRNTIDSFYSRGLPIEILINAMGYAMSRPKVTLDNKFRYLCGIAWNKVSEIEKHARSIFENGDLDDAEEEFLPTLKEEILCVIGQEAFEKELAEAHKRHENCMVNDSPEEDEQQAIVDILYSLVIEHRFLLDSVNDLMFTLPSQEFLKAWKETLREESEWREKGIGARVGTEARRLCRTATKVISNISMRYMNSLSTEEREEWILYASEINWEKPWNWHEPEEWLTQRAAGVAFRAAKGWPSEFMCFGPGEHIQHCPRRGTAYIALAACATCDVAPRTLSGGGCFATYISNRP